MVRVNPVQRGPQRQARSEGRRKNKSQSKSICGVLISLSNLVAVSLCFLLFVPVTEFSMQLLHVNIIKLKLL